MEPTHSVAPDTDADAALELFAVAPHALGGVVLRSAAGPRRDRLCARLSQMLAHDAPSVRVPLHITDDRLLGGLSLAASLRLGRTVFERGQLAAADGGVIVAPMAERLVPSRAAQLCSVLDRGSAQLERDGLSGVVQCRAGLLALDEGVDDERVCAALRDRLAFHIDLSAGVSALADDQRIDAEPQSRMLRVQEAPLDDERGPAARPWIERAEAALPTQVEPAVLARLDRARELWPRVLIDPAWVSVLCEAALALGQGSLRAPLLAATAARAHAALAGRLSVEEEDALVAARLVLGPRATQLPAEAQAPPEPEPDAERDSQDPASDSASQAQQTPQDLVVSAAKSGIPRQLLESLWCEREPRARPRSSQAGRAGALRTAAGGGRPVGVRAGQPSGSDRLNLVETLRAAAPWQRLRGRAPGLSQLALRKDDLRVTRYLRRSETTVIFSVDASGSAALQRLAEAKGAVEQLLTDCYARRDRVALVVFRERAASLLLPPTRSLTRVRRSLAGLAGGGATPLASGIAAAGALALEARKQGSLPILVLMTDARGNVARDGAQGSAHGMSDAFEAARSVRAQLVTSLLLDTSPRPRAPAQRLAAELGARYLPLPYLDAAGIAAEVRALSKGSA